MEMSSLIEMLKKQDSHTSMCMLWNQAYMVCIGGIYKSDMSDPDQDKYCPPPPFILPINKHQTYFVLSHSNNTNTLAYNKTLTQLWSCAKYFI